MPTINRAQDVISMLRSSDAAGQGPGRMSGNPAASEAQEVYQGGSLEDFLHGQEGYHLAARVESVHERWAREKTGREREWFEALSFYGGQQWCVWDHGRSTLRSEGKKASWQIRRTINKVMPIVQHVTSILTRGKIRFRCTPATTDLEDTFAGEAAEAGVDHYWKMLRFSRLFSATVKLASITGTSAHEIEWDQFAGPWVRTRSEPNARQIAGSFEMPTGVDAESGELTFGGQASGMRTTGRHRVNLLTPFNLVPDPKATGDDDGEGLIVIREVSLQWLRERFPDASPFLRSEPIGAANLGLHYLLLFQSMAARYNWSTYSHSSRDSVLLKTLYLPRSPRYPRGRMILVANYTLLFDGENPIYPDDPTKPLPKQRWPVFVYRHDWDGVSFWGRGLVPQLIDLQKTINQLVSKSLSIVFSMATPKWVASKVNEIKITDKPGEVIRVPVNMDPSKAVVLQRGAELPQSLTGFIGLLAEEMREVAGIREATMGQAPGGRMSGVGMDTLIGQDSARLEPVREAHYEVLGEEWAFMLALVQRYVPEEHLIRIAGTNQTAAVRMFSSADILSQTDVQVRPDSRLPQGAEARAQVLALLANAGFLQPQMNPHHQEIGLQAMDLGDEWKPTVDELRADEVKAKRENVLMEAGAPPFPEDVDNHLSHLVHHATYMKTERFERLPPQQKMLIRAHTEWHLLKWLEGMAQGLPSGMAMPLDPGAGTAPMETAGAPGGAAGPAAPAPIAAGAPA